MDAKKLKAIIMMGESTTVQFKERVDDSYKIGCEFVAFSNSQGGLLVVGVNDKTGEVTGLSYEEIQKTSNLLSNAASDNVSPSITIMIETVYWMERLLLPHAWRKDLTNRTKTIKE